MGFKIFTHTQKNVRYFINDYIGCMFNILKIFGLSQLYYLN